MSRRSTTRSHKTSHLKGGSRTWKRVAIATGSVIGVGLVGAGVFLALQWPKAALTSSSDALAQLKLSGVSQHITNTTVTVGGKLVPFILQNGAILPTIKLPVATPATITVSLQRPSWISWLTGKTEDLHERLITPVATLLNPVSIGSSNRPILSYFSKPVRIISVTGSNGTKVLNLASASATVSLLNAAGSSRAGTLSVAATPDSWEVLPAPSQLTYFRESSTSPIAVINPNPAALSPSSVITITLSQTIASAFGSKLPTIQPVINGALIPKGAWSKTTPYTLVYTPSTPDFWPSEQLTMTLPAPVAVALPSGGLAPANTTLKLQGATPSITRLQQLLAQLNYLPLSWTAATGNTPSTTTAELAQSALTTPNGSFAWRWAMPSNLTTLWQQGSYNIITRGAVMSFEQFNHLDTNGLANPLLWPTLIQDLLANKVDPHRYSWIEVNKKRPETVNLYENGSVVFTSLTNTGIPGLNTTVGTFPIYLRFVQNYMSGTNPNGTTYHDAVHWINYFLGSEAVHGFVRAQYGFPQSLGCVELPVSNAAIVYPQVHIGTLVTVVAQ
ncbi:MAG: L,D-transpeptidase [Ferrimicrobium sp.]